MDPVVVEYPLWTAYAFGYLMMQAIILMVQRQSAVIRLQDWLGWFIISLFWPLLVPMFILFRFPSLSANKKTGLRK